jgi:hypothetical protein
MDGPVLYRYPFGKRLPVFLLDAPPADPHATCVVMLSDELPQAVELSLILNCGPRVQYVLPGVYHAIFKRLFELCSERPRLCCQEAIEATRAAREALPADSPHRQGPDNERLRAVCDHNIATWESRMAAAREAASRHRCLQRCSGVKRELMARAWHPGRMQLWGVSTDEADELARDGLRSWTRVCCRTTNTAPRGTLRSDPRTRNRRSHTMFTKSPSAAVGTSSHALCTPNAAARSPASPSTSPSSPNRRSRRSASSMTVGPWWGCFYDPLGALN